jgi:hypothetical protein
MVNRHFKACSYPGKVVDYHSKGEASYGATDYRQSWQAEARTRETKQFIKNIKRLTRRK